MLFVHICVCANDPKSKTMDSNPNPVLYTKQVQNRCSHTAAITRQPNWEPSRAGEPYILEKKAGSHFLTETGSRKHHF